VDVRDLVKRCLHCAAPTRDFLAGATSPRLLILAYHSVSDYRNESFRYVDPGVVVSPAGFERQVAFLSQHYAIVSMDEVTDWVRGRRQFSRPAVAITFDDGYRDNYLHAYPILKKYRGTASFNVVTDAIGATAPLWTAELRAVVYRARQQGVTRSRIGSTAIDLSGDAVTTQSLRMLTRSLRSLDKQARREMLREITRTLIGPSGEATGDVLTGDVMMSWDELREMARGGMTIGSHSASHPALPEIPVAEVAREIADSKAKLEEELQTPAAHFVYPNPGKGIHVNEVVKALVRDAGYLTARTSVKGSVARGGDLFELNGININDHCSDPALLAWLLSERVERVKRAFSRRKNLVQESA
jgi:peptidoglycan/xylan/chitin deacetylase (PgdA/CDA1 family)